MNGKDINKTVNGFEILFTALSKEYIINKISNPFETIYDFLGCFGYNIKSNDINIGEAYREQFIVIINDFLNNKNMNKNIKVLRGLRINKKI